MATDTQHTRQLNTHIEANTKLMMGADQDKSGYVNIAGVPSFCASEDLCFVETFISINDDSVKIM